MCLSLVHLGPRCTTWQERNIVHLQKFLEELWDHQLFAKASKCEIAYKNIKFFGQQVTPARISPIKVKIKVVQEWDTSQDIKNVRTFLGFSNYYRWYVHQFAKVDHPRQSWQKRVWSGNGVRIKRKHSASSSRNCVRIQYYSTRPEASIYCGDKYFRGCNRGSVDARLGWRSTTPSIHEQSAEAIREALLNVWMWIGHLAYLFL